MTQMQTNQIIMEHHIKNANMYPSSGYVELRENKK